MTLDNDSAEVASIFSPTPVIGSYKSQARGLRPDNYMLESGWKDFVPAVGLSELSNFKGYAHFITSPHPTWGIGLLSQFVPSLVVVVGVGRGRCGGRGTLGLSRARMTTSFETLVVGRH
ncbi:hypothetical protein Pmani_023450 [Petrolisthes manimaculis]|uniref:Uncharacterized protein n=1 Tax=Petrolisthes manimaculis TaxID=1843537 RepID=A0AAE1PC59_9EUCA|nr:hypothetical protein Pmani_023450 [Petrolisthes manimaculis]